MREEPSRYIKAAINARRSQRVVAHVRLTVRRRSDAFMSEIGRTLVVNAHGALILISVGMNVQTGEVLVLKNFMSAEEQDARVLRVEENAVSQKQKEIAMEFVSPAPHFWHIDFPPDDWKTLEARPRL